MALVRCPECGAEVSSEANVCIKCGLPFEKLLRCPSCGCPVKDSDSVCGNCSFDVKTYREQLADEANKIKIENDKKTKKYVKYGAIAIAILVVVFFIYQTVSNVGLMPHDKVKSGMRIEEIESIFGKTTLNLSLGSGGEKVYEIDDYEIDGLRGDLRFYIKNGEISTVWFSAIASTEDGQEQIHKWMRRTVKYCEKHYGKTHGETCSFADIYLVWDVQDYDKGIAYAEMFALKGDSQPYPFKVDFVANYYE